MPLAFMCLNRVYEENSDHTIGNISTYIDPTIYNNIFAESRLSSQNFWVQVAYRDWETARNRRGCINNPDLAYQAEPREVKLKKIINGEANNMT